jgi:tRNA-specific 2-thiouridylase
MPKKKILVAMSGGVDSSTTAAFLKSQGHEIMGITMKLFNSPNGKESLKSCCGYGPAVDAKRVCEKLGIRHRVVNAEKQFKEKVIDNFCEEYMQGRTPNPCIRCNTYLKFDFLLKTAGEMGLDYIATGHYARITNGRLFQGIDKSKDQSYFLYTINKKNINRILFPLGNMCKADTRRLARKMGLGVHRKAESQDICFLPKGKYREFLEKQGKKGLKGFMYNTHGEIIGEHKGLEHYTVGQRKGLGPLGQRSYVISMDTKANTIIIGSAEDLAAWGMEVENINCCRNDIIKNKIYDVRIRYRSRACRGKIEDISDSRMRITFMAPVQSITPGQAAVLYNGGEVIGGGTICKKIDTKEAGH